jgi:hypothetical protein
MGGLPCAKQIIDNGNALHQQLQCMNASILLAAPSGVQPTYEEADEFKRLSEPLAKCAAAIEKRVRTATGV